MPKEQVKDAKTDKEFVVKKKKYSHGLPVRNQFSAGIDIGDSFCSIAISDGEGGFEVRNYPMFTEDLSTAVEWLVSENIASASMESTGVYWLNLYLMLEEAGIEPYLVNAKHVKNVTGRKTDDSDAVWLQKLHSCGLLQKSFQPDEWTRSLRNYVRQRKNLISIASDSVRRMQKALELLNIKIHVVISDLLGKTGMEMVRAIIGGERNPDELMKFKDSRVKAPDEIIRKSLVGIWNKDYVFMLKQAYDEYMFYQTQIVDCEEILVDMLLAHAVEITDDPLTHINVECKKKVEEKISSDTASALC